MKLLQIVAIAILVPLVCAKAYSVTGDLFYVVIGFFIVSILIVTVVKER